MGVEVGGTGLKPGPSGVMWSSASSRAILRLDFYFKVFIYLFIYIYLLVGIIYLFIMIYLFIYLF